MNISEIFIKLSNRWQAVILFLPDSVCDTTSDCTNDWDETTYTCCRTPTGVIPGQVQCGDDGDACVPFGKQEFFFDTSAMLLVAADVCDENHYMDCTNGWDESNCALGSEGEQFYLGSILNWQFRIQCI